MISCQDYREFLRGLDKDSVDLVLTDPPYGISQDSGYGSMDIPRTKDFGEWDKEPPNYNVLGQEMLRALRPGGTAIVWHGLWFLSDLHRALMACGFVKARFIQWQKTNPMPTNPSITYLSTVLETAVVVAKPGKGQVFNSYNDHGIYRLPCGRRVHHPTQKPLPLFTQLVEKHSNPGDLVVDPFLGSGTTALAALSTGRRFLGSDLNGEYVETARGRLVKDQLL